MGYYIRYQPNKKSFPNWKIQFITQKKDLTKGSLAKFPSKTWDVPKDRWYELGFRREMSLDEARGRQKQLNAQINLKRREEKRLMFEKEVKLLNQKCDGFLPEIYREEFELRYFYGGRIKRILKNKDLSHWRLAQKMILEIQLEPSYWYDEVHRFYDYFFKQHYSFSYIMKVLRVLNLWGLFISRKLGKPFFAIPRPHGFEKRRLIDAYFMRRGDSGNQSDPLTPEQLETAKSKLNIEHYNWLYLSVWLGLRPMEIDQLKDNQNVRVMQNVTGEHVVWIYQSKLASVPPRYRWKLIPIFLEQQLLVLEIISSKLFHRPLVKTWMGHSTIQRTWQNYKCRTLVHHTKLNLVERVA